MRRLLTCSSWKRALTIWIARKSANVCTTFVCAAVNGTRGRALGTETTPDPPGRVAGHQAPHDPPRKIRQPQGLALLRAVTENRRETLVTGAEFLRHVADDLFALREPAAQFLRI